METLQDLLQAAQSKGFKVDCSTNYFNRFGEQTTYPETHISIEIKDSVWYTWSGQTCGALDSDLILFFKGRYNKTNGATQKTFNKEFDAKVALGLIEKTW